MESSSWAGLLTPLTAKRLGGRDVHENLDADRSCSSHCCGEKFGEKKGGSLGHDGNIAVDFGMEGLDGFDDFADLSQISGSIEGVTQINERGGIGVTMDVGDDMLD